MPIIFKERLDKVNRFYDGIPSVTSILQAIKDPEFVKILIEKNGQEAWDAMMNIACLRGNELHFVLEQNYKDKCIPYTYNKSRTLPPLDKVERSSATIVSDPKYQKYIQGVYSFISLNEGNLQPIATELSLHSLELGIAGTMDLVCLIDGILTIIDWKTCSTAKFDNDRILKHSLQMSAYKKLWDTHNPDNKIKQCYVINFTDKRNSGIGEPIFLEEDDLERLWSEFQMVQSMFNLLVPDEAKVPLI